MASSLLFSEACDLELPCCRYLFAVLCCCNLLCIRLVKYLLQKLMIILKI